MYCKPIPVMKTGFSLCSIFNREITANENRFFPVWKYYTGNSLYWPCKGLQCTKKHFSRSWLVRWTYIELIIKWHSDIGTTTVFHHGTNFVQSIYFRLLKSDLNGICLKYANDFLNGFIWKSKVLLVCHKNKWQDS